MIENMALMMIFRPNWDGGNRRLE